LHGNESDVTFDYVGALSLARRIWALADQVDHTMRARGELSLAARQDFTGTYADQFTRRVSVEAANLTVVVHELHGDAEAFAAAWKREMEEENRRLYARHVDHVKKQRSLVVTLWDDTFGYRYPPPPDPIPQPTPPLFLPTADFVRYP
jgi:hypothetical protein